MNIRGPLVKQGAIWLIVGLIGGGIAADQWQRHQAARDLVNVTNWHADQLKDAQAKIDQLAKALDAERQRRQALEGVLADLRKGS
jgi:Skp family chaperone for outer membrane proteins